MLALAERVSDIIPVGLTGRVTRLSGLTIAAADFPVPVGALCQVHRGPQQLAEAEVVGFGNQETLLLPLGDITGLRRGDLISLRNSAPQVRVGEQMLGRVFNALGEILDDGVRPALPHRRTLYGAPPASMSRKRISDPLSTGIRAVDALLTCGKGQRVGLFAGSGVGKSTLLGQIARGSRADVNVIVLVGERGREVREFLEKGLGPDGLSRSVVIVATGDEAPTLRLRAAHFGTTVAEFFRDHGHDVLLLVDSLTRFTHAQREVGFAAGEPPAARGFPPSVFSALPKLVERTGQSESGSITGLYTVLVDGDDFNEPIADAVRGLLDGHWVLSRRLAEQAHWPALDVLASVSRVMPDVTSPQHRATADQFKRALAAFRHHEDMISVGAYQPGSHPLVDAALRERPRWTEFLQQSVDQATEFTDTLSRLRQLAERLS
ncbi:MAG: FliI/YscN family ATPase [Planctomycetes bacterium]|nr:FliI/YscN family ATPase [Planctomycetota bacterium]